MSTAIRKSMYSTTDFDDNCRKSWVSIPIPEGFRYVDSSITKTTELGNFYISPITFLRHSTFTDRIVEVRAFVEAKNRFLARSWIGADLIVTVEPRQD